MARPKRSEETTRRLRAELLEHASTIVRRDGAAALTMRALAAEVGVSLGLPYKIFADRREIVTEIVRREINTLRAASEELVATAGRGTVGDNLTHFAEAILDSPAAPLRTGASQRRSAPRICHWGSRRGRCRSNRAG